MSGKPDAEKPGGSLGTVFGVIPTIYYDIIARVVPGLAIWFAIWLSTASNADLKSVRTFLEGNVLIVLLLSYLVGMVLTGVSAIWDALCFVLFWLVKPLRLALGLEKGLNFLGTWEVVAEKMEAIAKANETAGGTVTKALAEVAMTENLLTGTIALAIAGGVSSGRIFPSPADSWPYLLAAVSVLLPTVVFRQAMLLGRVKVLYIMHCTK